MSLKNKKVVICRRPEQSNELVHALEREGAFATVIPTFSFEPKKLRAEEIQIIENLQPEDWLVLGSQNAVVFFHEIIGVSGIKSGSRIAVIGKKTSRKWRGLFPSVRVRFTGDSLQQTLDKIAEMSEKACFRVFNPTSEQSLDYLSPSVPDHMQLMRMAIYQTRINDNLTSEELEFLKSGQYDSIFFSSPSSFNYYLDLTSGRLLNQDFSICVAGKTTAQFVQSKGFRVDVIPIKPYTEYVVNALKQFYGRKMKSNISVSSNTEEIKKHE